MTAAHIGYFDTYKDVFATLNWDLIGFSAIFFMIGVLMAPTIIERNLRWLTAYPEWAFQKIERFVEKKPSVLKLFLVIFLLNTLSILLVYLSGFTIVLPFFLIIWSGINSGILLYKNTGGGIALVLFFLNPVALFELPANWIGFSLPLEMSLFYFHTFTYKTVLQTFQRNFFIFLWLVIPLLVLAALIEASLIHKFGTGTDESNNNGQDT
ncbi:MAG: stage II sporulation protein M [Calditrichaeota bacterium]|nr:stage II sporulation protein M [Calditrichota bacterium]